MADDDLERLRELENAMEEEGYQVNERQEPLDDQPNNGNGLNQMAVDEDLRQIMDGMDPEELEMNRILLMDAERRQRRARGEDRDAGLQRERDAFARAVLGEDVVPLNEGDLVARAFMGGGRADPAPLARGLRGRVGAAPLAGPPRPPFRMRIAGPNWRDQQLREWGDGQGQQQGGERAVRVVDEVEQGPRERRPPLLPRIPPPPPRPVVMRRVVRGEGDEEMWAEDRMGRPRIELIDVVGDLLMEGRRGDFGGVRLEFGGARMGMGMDGGGAVTEEMKKEAKMLREKDENTPCPTRFSRACPICVIENPHQRAVFVQCGHIVCYSCAVENASSDATNGKCVFCCQKSDFVKLFEEPAGSEKKEKGDDKNESKTDGNRG